MVGTGSRLFFAFAVVGLIGAGAYGVASGGDPIGVVSMGYKGGVGEHLGYVVLTTMALTSLAIAVALVLLRDGDPVPVAAGDAGEVVAAVPPPANPIPWPALTALGLVLAALGLVVGALFFVIGLVVLAVAAIEWTVSTWADRATGDPAVNKAIRDRLMAPIEVPVGAALVIGFLVLGMSRVFLAVSATWAVAIATVLMVLIVAGAFVVFTRPDKSRKVAGVLLGILALAVLAGGIAGVAAGSREFHHEEHEAEAGAEG